MGGSLTLLISRGSRCGPWLSRIRNLDPSFETPSFVFSIRLGYEDVLIVLFDQSHKELEPSYPSQDIQMLRDDPGGAFDSSTGFHHASPTPFVLQLSATPAFVSYHKTRDLLADISILSV